MSPRARHRVALRLAALGAALSVGAAAGVPVAFAADQPIGATVPATPPVKPPAAPDKPGADAPVADAELIEFLGSIGDTESGGDWLDFLNHADVDRVAKRGAKTPTRDR